MAGGRVVEYFTTQPIRVSALLRLPLIGLIVALVSVWDVDHWLPLLYVVILSVYAAVAVLWLVVVFRGPIPPWAEWASTAVDVLVLIALCAVSGGATAALLPVFFLLPISVAFQDRPWLTALLGGSTVVGYLAVWILYSKRDDSVGLPDIVYLHVGFLAWLAIASTALSIVLARRSARVRALMEVRRQLVSESIRADDLRNVELAEHLHDGPLQTLLAARLDLDEIRERIPDPGLDRVRAALQEAAAGLRSTVTALHPQVLAQLGLAPAVRELLRQYENRPELTVRADLEEVGQPEVQVLLYRAARELLANVNTHAGVSTISVSLYRSGERVVLTVADDGNGGDGQIRLSALQVRIEAVGGSMTVSSEAGLGTQVRVML